MKKNKGQNKSQNAPASPSSRRFINGAAFSVFVIAAAAHLAQALLSVFDYASPAIGIIKNLVTIALFLIAAVLGWSFVKRRKAVWVAVYFIALIVIVAAYLLPLFF